MIQFRRQWLHHVEGETIELCDVAEQRLVETGVATFVTPEPENKSVEPHKVTRKRAKRKAAANA